MKSLLDFRDAYSGFCNALEGLNEEVTTFATRRQQKLSQSIEPGDVVEKMRVAISISPFVPKNIFTTLTKVAENAFMQDRSITFEDIAHSSNLVDYSDLDFIFSLDISDKNEDEIEAEVRAIELHQQKSLYRYLLLINFATEEHEDYAKELDFPLLCEKMLYAITQTKLRFPELKAYNPKLFTPQVLKYYWSKFFAKEEFYWFLEKIYADQIVELHNYQEYHLADIDKEDRHSLIACFEETTGDIVKHLDQKYFGLQLVA